MKDKIIQLVTDFLDETGADIDDMIIDENSSLLSDLDFSSLEIMDLLSRVEDEYNIHIKERDMQYINTVGDLVNCVEREMV